MEALAMAAQSRPLPPPAPFFVPQQPTGFAPQRIAIIIAAGAGMLGTFLPWVTVPILGSVNGTAGDGQGWIPFGLLAVSLVTALLGTLGYGLSGEQRLIGAGTALAASGVALWKVIEFKKKMSDAPDDNPIAKALASSVQLGPGLIVIILAGIAVAIIAFTMSSGRPSRYPMRRRW